MVRIQFHPSFQKTFKKISDILLKQKVLKQLEKIKQNPEVGKPMRYSKKGTRELYISPYRLSYLYSKETDIVKIIALYHKDEQ